MCYLGPYLFCAFLSLIHHKKLTCVNSIRKNIILLELHSLVHRCYLLAFQSNHFFGREGEKEVCVGGSYVIALSVSAPKCWCYRHELELSFLTSCGKMLIKAW